ncbi:unnamed protein product [Linum trigynum]|uniref:Uncharacterized protein n=1 Tax=Linum trigynum TaxID=586398 RepID=A0AAV2FN90_9ROSI
MARWSFLLLALLCAAVLPTLTTSKYVGKPFVVRGRVYCDTCRCGFETNKTTYIPGAMVAIKCFDRKTMNLKYRDTAVTDKHGRYEMTVQDDHEDQLCRTVLVSSPWGYCKVPDEGRRRSEVILTRSNGAVSNLHFANAMGFVKEEAEEGCKELVHHLLYADV